MNDTTRFKAGVVLAHISWWCGILPYIAIFIFLLVCFVSSSFLSFVDNSIAIVFSVLLKFCLVCPLLAVLLGHSALMLFRVSGVSHTRARDKIKSGLIAGYILLILCGLFFISGANTKICNPHRPLKVSNDLGQLYLMMTIYAQDWNNFPKVTPEGGNGVRDLYPLYETGILKSDMLKLLQPPSCELLPFSENPTIDEFNRDHIGFSYNSTVIPDDPNTPPLLADQGVSSGSLNLTTKDRGIKPREENGALVLFSNGAVEFINVVNKRGKLSTSKISSNEWTLLKDNATTNSTISVIKRHKNTKQLCALVFVAFIAFIGILYTAKIWQTRIRVRNE